MIISKVLRTNLKKQFLIFSDVNYVQIILAFTSTFNKNNLILHLGLKAVNYTRFSFPRDSVDITSKFYRMYSHYFQTIIFLI